MLFPRTCAFGLKSQVEREMRQKRLEDEQLKECTFKPRLYWGNKVPTNRRKPLVSGGSVTSSRGLTTSQGDHQGGSGQHVRISVPKQKVENPSPQRENPIPNIKLSPIKTGIHPLKDLDRNPSELRYSRKDKIMMPPLPLEITTTVSSLAPSSPARQQHDWKNRLYSRKAAVSPLGSPTLGVGNDLEVKDSPIAPRKIFSETTVGGESADEQTQRTEYGSI